MVLKITDLLVGNYMTSYPISVKPDVSFDTVVDFMVRRGMGNLIVSENDFPKGILTEREILQSIVSEKGIPIKKVSEIGHQPYHKISPDVTILEAANIMISKKSRLLVFVGDDKLVGIITASDMLRAFRKTDEAPALDDVISTHIYQCSSKASILDAVTTMQEKGVGSVVISDVSNYGIFTERDLLTKILLKKIDLNNSLEGYFSHPLVTAKKGILANKASNIMAANNIKRLGIIDDKKLIGIVTARDLVDVFQGSYQIQNPYL